MIFLAGAGAAAAAAAVDFFAACLAAATAGCDVYIILTALWTSAASSLSATLLSSLSVVW